MGHSSISIRFNSIYISLVWSVLVASFGEYFRAWHSRKQASQGSTDVQANLQSNMQCSRTQIQEERVSSMSLNGHPFSLMDVESPDSFAGGDSDPDATTSFDHRSALSGVVSVSIVSGRPDFQDIIDPIGNSSTPATLLCGPEKLRDNIRRIIRSDNKCAKKCSIY